MLLCEPTTAYTAEEVWCRLDGHDWKPILQEQLSSNNADMVRLVLNVLRVEAEIRGSESLGGFEAGVAACLRHAERLVRQAAILLTHESGWASDRHLAVLRRIVQQDETMLRRDAAKALIDLDPRAVESLGSKLGSSP